VTRSRIARNLTLAEYRCPDCGVAGKQIVVTLAELRAKDREKYHRIAALQVDRWRGAG
jgi:hypothetical protein